MPLARSLHLRHAGQRLTALCLRALGVVRPTQRTQVVQRVVVGLADVVDLGRPRYAALAVLGPRAAVAVASEDTETQRRPVGRERRGPP